jgi:assimilatory nitrate reductase catalytic subunit
MLALAFRKTEQPDAYPLTLNTGRVRDQWHTMTRTGRVPHLMVHMAGPSLALHPADAAQRGIADGGLVRINSPHGSAVLRATVDTGMRQGDVFFTPMHWTDQFASCGPVDRLVHALADPVSGQPDLKGTAVEAEAIAECWRGLLLRQADGIPIFGDDIYWSKVPVAAGFAYEMSGWSSLAELIHSDNALRQLLRVSETAALVSYSDPNKLVFRYAAVIEGRLQACVFFAGPHAVFTHADQAARLLGQVIEPHVRLSLLAGVTAGAAHHRIGTIVCSCFAVGEEEIRAAIRAGKLTSPSEIGGVLNAGTNCGSCIPELKKLLVSSASEFPAAAYEEICRVRSTA